MFGPGYAVAMEREAGEKKVKHISVDRSQIRWAEFDLESLIEQDHAARTIWELSGKFDLKRFEEGVQTRQGEAGRPCWSARLLVSVWVYGYTLGVASARAIERMMAHEPGLRWLTGDQRINYHTLAGFRVGHEEALKELFAQFLAVLDEAAMVDLKTLLHDGTKVKSVAGKWSFRRRKTVEKQLREARQVVRKLDEEAAAESEGLDERRRAARERAVREGLQRAEAALEKLKKLAAAAPPSERDEQRVSVSEADARKMKHPDGGWAPSYNVQVTSEAQSRMIVAVSVTTAANDTQELMPALEKVKENCGKLPERVIADNGYATRSNVEETAKQNIELIAPWKGDASREAGACKRNGIATEFAPSAFRAQRGGQKLTCPAGKTLVLIGEAVQHGLPHNIFRASTADCSGCQQRQKCCGEQGGPREISRVVESTAMKQYQARMKQPQIRELYRKRSEIAEFPHLWAKAVKGWRRFSVRGKQKAGIEAMWVALAYNVAQWMRLRTVEA
jgi:transposase